jgi:hypothetical protein
MRKLVTVLVLLAFGCGAATTPEVRSLVAENRRPEARELPVDARTEPLPEGTPTEPGENYVVPLEAGSCIPEHGITVPESDEPQVVPGPCPTENGLIVSEARANRDAIYRIRYEELRRTVEADRQVWSAHRELYEAQVAADREEIERLQPTWWEQHDGEILAALGVIVGAAVTVAITFAVNEASE